MLNRFFAKTFTKSPYFKHPTTFFQKGFSTCRPYFGNHHFYHNHHKRGFCRSIFWKVLVPGTLVYGLYTYTRDDKTETQGDRVNKLIEDFKAELQKVIEEKGEDSREASRIYHALGVSLSSLKYYDEGLKYLDKAIEIGKKVADDGITYAKSLTEAAHTHASKGEMEKSLKLLNDSLDIVKKTYGENSKEAGVCLNTIGATYIRVQDYKKATENLQVAYSILQRTDGEDGIETIACLYNLSEAHKRSGEKALSIRVLEDEIIL